MEKNTKDLDLPAGDVNNPTGNELEKLNLANQGKIIAEQKQALTLASQREKELLEAYKKLEEQTKQSQNNAQSITQTNTEPNQLDESIKNDLIEFKSIVAENREIQRQNSLKPMFQILDDYNVAVDDRAALFEGIKDIYNVDLLANPNPALFNSIMVTEQEKINNLQNLPNGLNSEFVGALANQKQQENRNSEVNALVEKQFKNYAMSKGKK